MVVGGSRQETLDPGFVLLGTRPANMRELVLPGGFDLVSSRVTVRDVTTDFDGVLFSELDGLVVELSSFF
ncbi:unnamed protein product [Schistosoma mattheei]|uniref:Uncharacterized protein n=1 Tax=Schistosoma mattheei TaxID=31246 RepID=A0A183P9I4_9TREM|nr:unnamed protein product [Schistosoma mattheei]